MIFHLSSNVQAKIPSQHSLENVDKAMGLGISGVSFHAYVMRENNDNLNLSIRAQSDNKVNRALIDFTDDVKQRRRRIIVNNDEIWFYRTGLRKPVPLSQLALLSGPTAMVNIMMTSFSRDYDVIGAGQQDQCGNFYKLKARSSMSTYPLLELCLDGQSGLLQQVAFKSLQGRLLQQVSYHYNNQFNGSPFVSELHILDGVIKNKETHIKINKVEKSSFNKRIFLPKNQGKAFNYFFESFQPVYWKTIDYSNQKPLVELKEMIQQMDALVTRYQEEIKSGEHKGIDERKAIANVFFHFGHMLHSNVLVTLEGRVNKSDWIVEPYQTLTDVMRRSVAVLQQGVALDPEDRRVKTALLAARINQDWADQGKTNPDTIIELIDYATDNSEAAQQHRNSLFFPNFDLMVALLTLRNVYDPNYQFVFDYDGKKKVNHYMVKLAEAAAERLVPDKIPGFDDALNNNLVPDLHFVVLTAPLLKIDYFLRYSNDLISSGDFNAAKAQLKIAQNTLNLIRNRLHLLVQHYPLGDVVTERERIAEQIAAAISKMDQRVSKNLNHRFRKHEFTQPYLCSSCHAN